jgi:hypothetical protein
MSITRLVLPHLVPVVVKERARFTELGAAVQGFLTKTELAVILPAGLCPQDRDAIFIELDTNGDGVITEAEWAGYFNDPQKAFEVDPDKKKDFPDFRIPGYKGFRRVSSQALRPPHIDS